MRVCSYTRVSTTEQLQGWSVEAQRNAIRRHAERRGDTIVAELADEGASAKPDSLDKRPGFRAAVEMVRRGEADAIMVHKPDRAARNLRVLLNVLHQLNGGIMAVEGDFDYTTAEGKLRAHILGSVAQWFSDNLATETRKGKMERRAAGLWLGPLPYGYRKRDGDEHGKLPPLLDDVARYTLPDGRQWSPVDVVRHIFTEAARGTPRADIVAGLRALGVTDVSRGKLNCLVRNRFYVGLLPVKRSQRSEGAEAWLPGLQPAIIDQALYDEADAAARQNRRGLAVIRHSARVYPLSGVCQCGRCGAPLHCMTDHGRPRLFCASRGSNRLCDQISVRAHVIEARVVEAMERYAPPEDIARRIAEVLTAEDAGDTMAAEADIRAAREKLRDLYLNFDHLTRADYERRSRELDERLALVRAQRTLRPDVEELTRHLHDLKATYELADERERNTLIRRVFRAVLVDNQELVATRPVPPLDAMLRRQREIMTTDLDGARSCASQVYGSPDAADWLRPLPDGWWAVPLAGKGLSAYPKIPRAWWPQLARERAEGMTLTALAERYSVRSHRTVSLILARYEAEHKTSIHSPKEG